MDLLGLLALDNLSMHMIKIYGDKWSLCLISLVTYEKVKALPFRRIEIAEEVMHDMIKLTISWGKQK